MALIKCKNGHRFEKSSDCRVCPICSGKEMKEKYGVDFANIPAPALRALDRMGIGTLSGLAKYSEKDLLSQHGFGPKAAKLLKEKLAEKGMAFTDKI